MGLFRLLTRLIASPKRSSHTLPPSRPLGGSAHGDIRRVNPDDFRPRRETLADAALVGRCWVIDGDTIDIGGTRIRLAGIDAPELGQPFGQNAKWALVKLCNGQQVRAVFEGGMSHDRTVATCYLPDGRDLSAEMVKAGLAIDWGKFSEGKYRQLEPAGVRRRLWRSDAR